MCKRVAAPQLAEMDKWEMLAVRLSPSTMQITQQFSITSAQLRFNATREK